MVPCSSKSLELHLQAAELHSSYGAGGQDWPGECGNGLTQSPINIVPGALGSEVLVWHAAKLKSVQDGVFLLSLRVTGYHVHPEACCMHVSRASHDSINVCCAATRKYTRLAPKLDFGTGKTVSVINTGHSIQVHQLHLAQSATCRMIAHGAFIDA